MNPRLLKQCAAEFVGTFTLIFVGIGAIANNTPTSGLGLLGVAFAHGLAIGVMVTATGAISGGQLNPAVTFGLLVGGQMDLKKSIAYWISQLAGGTAAALLCASLLGMAAVSGGTPDISLNSSGAPVVSTVQAITIEAVLTFFLVFVVYGSAVDARAPKIGGLAIGLTVALDIMFGGPLTGAAMNPARTFGPALASGHWNNHIVYWAGPLAGGALAGLIYGRFLIRESRQA
ncbi:MAG TPA: MIP/aquaporin family protein [Verrucomicrobiae bacterium]|jgi:MIP family channel proteins|nr:MIP/aquaporin family protein [Verrucomicrobiae bacterium]